MNVIHIEQDRSLRWGYAPDPVPNDDEVLIDVYACGVNRADLMQRAGQYPPPPGSPPWMGLEAAGVVRAAGKDVPPSADLTPGKRVCALLGGGGYAEQVCVRWDHTMLLPDGMDMIHGAALPEVYATAWLNLVHEAHAAPGETLLVPAGTSGLADALIPLAKRLGLRVIATVRDENGKAAVLRLGADRVVNTATESLPDALRAEEEQGRPVNIAVDCVGGPAVGECLPYLAYGARYIVIAALAGNETTVDLRTVYVKNLRLIGSTLRSRPAPVKAEVLRALSREVLPALARGELRQTICGVFPITQAEAAHAAMEGKHVGKIVLTVKDEM